MHLFLDKVLQQNQVREYCSWGNLNLILKLLYILCCFVSYLEKHIDTVKTLHVIKHTFHDFQDVVIQSWEYKVVHIKHPLNELEKSSIK